TRMRALTRLGALRSLLIAGALLAVLWAAFDSNWFRAPLQNWLSERSGRPVRIGAMRITLGLHPSLRLWDFYVPNADWSGSDRPLIDAREAQFILSLATIFEQPRVLTMVVLRDAEVNMEMLADGRRNWRLFDPDYRGPGRYTVERLDAVNTKLSIVNRRIDLELHTAASAAD